MCNGNSNELVSQSPTPQTNTNDEAGLKFPESLLAAPQTEVVDTAAIKRQAGQVVEPIRVKQAPGTPFTFADHRQISYSIGGETYGPFIEGKLAQWYRDGYFGEQNSGVVFHIDGNDYTIEELIAQNGHSYPFRRLYREFDVYDWKSILMDFHPSVIDLRHLEKKTKDGGERALMLRILNSKRKKIVSDLSPNTLFNDDATKAVYAMYALREIVKKKNNTIAEYKTLNEDLLTKIPSPPDSRSAFESPTVSCDCKSKLFEADELVHKLKKELNDMTSEALKMQNMLEMDSGRSAEYTGKLERELADLKEEMKTFNSQGERGNGHSRREEELNDAKSEAHNARMQNIYEREMDKSSSVKSAEYTGMLEKELAELKKENESFKNENETFKKENETFKKENETFKKENETFKKENETFKKENETFKKENETFKKENETFKKENETFKEENETFKEEKETFKENEKILSSLVVILGFFFFFLSGLLLIAFL